MIPGISRNWRLTSSTIRPAARPTAFMVRPKNTNASIASTNIPTITLGLTRTTSKRVIKSMRLSDCTASTPPGTTRRLDGAELLVKVCPILAIWSKGSGWQSQHPAIVSDKVQGVERRQRHLLERPMLRYRERLGPPSGCGTHRASRSSSGKSASSNWSLSTEKKIAWPRDRFALPTEKYSPKSSGGSIEAMSA